MLMIFASVFKWEVYTFFKTVIFRSSLPDSSKKKKNVSCWVWIATEGLVQKVVGHYREPAVHICQLNFHEKGIPYPFWQLEKTVEATCKFHLLSKHWPGPDIHTRLCSKLWSNFVSFSLQCLTVCQSNICSCNIDFPQSVKLSQGQMAQLTVWKIKPKKSNKSAKLVFYCRLPKYCMFYFIAWKEENLMNTSYTM